MRGHDIRLKSLASREESSSPPSQAEPCPRPSILKWTTEEIKRFRTAAQLHGLHSNKILAAAVGSRTCTQVAKFKARYIQQNGQWAYKYLNPHTFGSQRDQATQSSPSQSPSSRRSVSSHSTPTNTISPSSSHTRSPPSSSSTRTASPVVTDRPNLQIDAANILLTKLRSKDCNTGKINILHLESSNVTTEVFPSLPARPVS